MATATRTRRTRAEAPAVQNVTTRRGGRVHRAHPVLDFAFPACRTGSQTRNPVHGRYVTTTDAVTCEKCLATADQLPQEAVSTAGRLKKTPPRAATRSRRNGTAQDEANVKAKEIVAEETAKVVAKRAQTPADPDRKPGCSDEDYALAVQVRTLRAAGGAWWAIAHAMGLKGAGPSAKEGKTGAAHARRLWEKAWGPTYKDTTVQRETKAVKVERAATQPSKPYFAHDAEETEILDTIKGKTIEWVARVGNSPETIVHSVLTATVSGLHPMKVVQGPKGRVVVFYELPEPGSRVSGPQRSVYVDRIEKVSL